MTKVSEIISKHIVSLYNGNIEGVVDNVLFNEKTKRAKYLSVYHSDTDTRLVLPMQNIFSSGNGAITVRNSSALELMSNLELELERYGTPMNNYVYKTNGDNLGRVVDCVLDDKYYIKELHLSNNDTLKTSAIASITDNLVLAHDAKNKVNINNFFERKKVNNIHDNRVVSILDMKDNNTLSAGDNTIIPTILPNKAITNYKFLLDRKVNKDITSRKGEVIIKENSKINASIIKIARINGKINELTKHSN